MTKAEREAKKAQELETLTEYRNKYTKIFDSFDKLDDTLGWVRLKHMNAYVSCNDDYFVLKSYNTIVAIYDIQRHMIIERGRYSNSTYRQVKAFLDKMRNMYFIRLSGEDYWNSIGRFNLELVNWYN